VILLIDPSDVLMFRESKPFGIEHHLARTTLPLPQTIAGAIRSAIYLSNDSKTVKDVIGYGNEEPGFEILGTFFYRKVNDEVEILSECPRDITDTLRKVEPYRVGGIGVTIFKGVSIHFKPFNGFLSFDGLVEYLSGKEVGRENLVRREGVFVLERRVGIALTESRVTKEKHFYQTEMLRLRNGFGIAVWLDENLAELADQGMLRLGGEGRFARFEKLHLESGCFAALTENWNNIRKEINKNGRVKLYFSTPAIFENGGYTSKLSESELEEKLEVKKVEVVASLTGKPLSFSGWDYVAKKPKPTRYSIPAGSVYFIEFEGELNTNKPYLKLGKLTNLGYGLCFLGVW
jgi:CRISPR-associated protein Cmr3